MHLTVEYLRSRNPDRWQRVRLFTKGTESDEIAAVAYALAWHCLNELTTRVRRDTDIVWTSDGHEHNRAEQIGPMFTDDGV